MMPVASVVAALHLVIASATGTFSPWFVDRGVQVEISRANGKIPWIRGTFDVPAPPARVIAALSDFKNYKQLFAPALQNADVVEAGTDMARMHLVWPYPTPLRDRDAIVVYRVERTPTGGAILSWKGEARPKDPKTGVRIDHVEGETKIEPTANGTATHVVYTYFGDLGGNFPESIKDRAWRAEPVGYMQAIRRAVGLPIVPKSQ